MTKAVDATAAKVVAEKATAIEKENRIRSRCPVS